MKLLITFLSFFVNSANAYLSHDQIAKSLAANKVGKAPQMSCKGAKKHCGPKPQYNKLDEVIPKKERAKHKHHKRKKDYSNHRGEHQ